MLGIFTILQYILYGILQKEKTTSKIFFFKNCFFISLHYILYGILQKKRQQVRFSFKTCFFYFMTLYYILDVYVPTKRRFLSCNKAKHHKNKVK